MADFSWIWRCVSTDSDFLFLWQKVWQSDKLGALWAILSHESHLQTRHFVRLFDGASLPTTLYWRQSDSTAGVAGLAERGDLWRIQDHLALPCLIVMTERNMNNSLIIISFCYGWICWHMELMLPAPKQSQMCIVEMLSKVRRHSKKKQNKTRTHREFPTLHWIESCKDINKSIQKSIQITCPNIYIDMILPWIHFDVLLIPCLFCNDLILWTSEIW